MEATMKIKALTTLRGDEGMIRRGSERDVSDSYGKELIKRKLAVAVGESSAEKPANNRKTKDARASNEGE
jgi:hypothetical protein